MACGRPILAITGLNTPLTNLVDSLSIGMTVTDYNADTLSKTISEMLNSPEGLDLMGTNSRNTAVNLYSRKNIVNEYRKVLSSLTTYI